MDDPGPSGQQILVTGGAGFIGSHVADALVDDNDVAVYDDFSSGAHENVPTDATVIEADVRDTDTLKTVAADADVVFHEAAQVSVRHSVEAPTESRDTNVDPLLAILEAARNAETRVVFASSAAIYGHPEYVPVGETHPKEPASPYGLEKLTGDHYCRLYHDLYGVETVALRYFNVYGPRQQGGDYSAVISIFSEQAQVNEAITVEGDGTQTRDFVHIDDVVRANLLAAASDEAVGEAFNIGTGESVTIHEVAETIKRVTDSNSEIVHVDGRDGDIDRSCADVTKAEKRLGYEPTLDIETGLQEYRSDR